MSCGIVAFQPRQNHPDRCERLLDRLGRTSIASAEIVGTRDDQVFR
jgi:hypothetical protein